MKNIYKQSLKRYLRRLLKPDPLESPAILLREWGSVAVVIVLMGSLILISECTRVRTAQIVSELSTSNEQKKIEVHVLGAVERPGSYQCDPGTSLGQLLKEVKLSKSADRKHIEFKKILFCSQVVEIPQKAVTSKRKNSKRKQPRKFQL